MNLFGIVHVILDSIQCRKTSIADNCVYVRFFKRKFWEIISIHKIRGRFIAARLLALRNMVLRYFILYAFPFILNSRLTLHNIFFSYTM